MSDDQVKRKETAIMTGIRMSMIQTAGPRTNCGILLLSAAALLVLCEYHEATRVPGCSGQDFEECMSKFRHVLDNSTYVFPDDKDKLDLACGVMEEGYNCLNESIKNCFNPDVQRAIFLMMESDFVNYDKLCNPGELQEAYLKHATCYRDIALSEAKCKPQYKAMLEPMKERLVGQIDDNYYMSTWCCESSTFVECFESFVDNCGTDASNMAAFYLDLTTGYKNDMCIDSTKNFTSCLAGPNTQQQTPTPRPTAS